ncbi:calcineurin subunit B-like [Apostichopus japonicus]|uniref:calcineurin subunit B-like n=1 Tax=Stichopus japonicus TaxID=307972 RepID=UPI003AB86D37
MGNQVATLTPEKVKELEEKTHFDEKEIKLLLQRYANYDTSPNGSGGIPIDVLLNSPELSGSPFARRLTWSYLKDGKRKIHPESYLLLLSVLSSKATFQEKSKALFQSLDIHNEGHVRFDEFFRLFKSIFNPALSDAQIVAFVQRVLQRDDLDEKGIMGYQDFIKFVRPQELHEKMTIDLRLST